jgi:asparagine synthase (glutamine-hydrolysing)
MCGIAGIFSRVRDAGDLNRRVTLMTSSLIHRGPDAGATISLANTECGSPVSVAFGHRRLAIIDLSDAAAQPMRDVQNANVLTYNGEIFNHRELRTDLAQRGHRFISQSDTEVILKAYAEWGVGAWRKLEGMFAFAIWDERNRDLHLVRDQMGIKPLYYANQGSCVTFASEVRGILASGLVDRRLSYEGLDSYLRYGSVQEPSTFIAGIQSIAPGSYLTVSANGLCNTRKYWSLLECTQRNVPRRISAMDIFPAIEETIERQLVSDAPLGVFLSGGIDSSAIAALAAKGGRAVKTFCIRADDPFEDESAYAEATANHLKCEHSTLTVTGAEMRRDLSAALASYDQPSHDGLNTYIISSLIRKAGIKVALSGLGGDELFVGYSGFRKAQRVARLGEYNRLLPTPLLKALRWCLGKCTPVGSSRGAAIETLCDPSLPASYFAARTMFCESHRARLTTIPASSGAAWMNREKLLAEQSRDLSLINSISYLEMQTYMLSTLLRDADQMSMAHGLEIRVPFVDSRLVEKVLPIEAFEKTGGANGKKLLLAAVQHLLPTNLSARPKRGFTLPLKTWLSVDLRRDVEAVFFAHDLKGPWDKSCLRAVWRDFLLGRVSWTRVQTIYVLEDWLQRHAIRS